MAAGWPRARANPEAVNREIGEGRVGKDGESKFNSIPGWAKVFAYLVLTVGVPPLMIGYFLARDAGWIDSPMTYIGRATAQTLRRQEELDRRLTVFIDKFTLAQRIACENTATLPNGTVNQRAFSNCQNIR